MPRISLAIQSRTAGRKPAGPVLVGVLGSGNLEILIEIHGNEREARFNVDTSLAGFDDTWRAVVSEFAARFPVGGLSFSMHDHGANPAVVFLRLIQALEIRNRAE
jgi:malonate decarboxylase delta subunit